MVYIFLLCFKCYIMYIYRVISYKIKTDSLHHYRLTYSKSEALRFLRDAEAGDCDEIRLFISNKSKKK